MRSHGRSYVDRPSDRRARFRDRRVTRKAAADPGLFCLTVISDVASHLGGRRARPHLYDALSPFAGRFVAIHPGLTAIAPTDQLLGRLSALRGPAAAARNTSGLQSLRCRQIGARTLGARAAIAYAEPRLAYGDAAATRTAQKLLVHAADAADELGCTPSNDDSTARRPERGLLDIFANPEIIIDCLPRSARSPSAVVPALVDAAVFRSYGPFRDASAADIDCVHCPDCREPAPELKAASWMLAHRRISHGIPADMRCPDCGSAMEAASLREAVAFRHRHAICGLPARPPRLRG